MRWRSEGVADKLFLTSFSKLLLAVTLVAGILGLVGSAQAQQTATVGEPFIFPFQVSTDVPENVTLEIFFPASFRFESATVSQGACTGSTGTVTCNLGLVSPGQPVTGEIVVVPTEPGTFVVPFRACGTISGCIEGSFVVTVSPAAPTPTPALTQPPVIQEIEIEEAHSGDVEPSIELSNTGDNTNLCSAPAQAASSGNVQNVQAVNQFGVDESGEVEFEGSTITLNPKLSAVCDQTLRQATAAG